MPVYIYQVQRTTPGSTPDGLPGHRFEIVDETWIRNLDGFCAKESCHQLVNDESVLGGNHVVAGAEKAVSDQLDNFVRAISEDHIFP